MKGVTAVVLAGGAGTRLRPAIGELPKSLAPLAGRPFLAILFDQLAGARVDRVVLATGYGADQVASAARKLRPPFELVFSPEPDPRGTGGALALAGRHVQGEDLLVLNGDSYCGMDVSSLVSERRRRRAAGTVALVPGEAADGFGRVEIDRERRILRFVEKPSSPAPGWINAGVYALSADLIWSIPRDRSVSLEREMFPSWIQRGLAGVPTDSTFFDIGVPERLARAEALLLAGSSR